MPHSSLKHFYHLCLKKGPEIEGQGNDVTEGVWRSEETQDVREEGTKPASAQGKFVSGWSEKSGWPGICFQGVVCARPLEVGRETHTWRR